MNLILIDRNLEMINAWSKYFRIDNVEIIQGDITNIEVDAIVSPANSFGYMYGGLDKQLSVLFGDQVVSKIQSDIKSTSFGELLIGQAIVNETNNRKVPYVISAPTVRVPGLDVGNSIHAYLAARAVFSLALQTERIKSIAITGLCTGIGNMDRAVCAYQMHQAYKETILEKALPTYDAGLIKLHHKKLNPNI